MRERQVDPYKSVAVNPWRACAVRVTVLGLCVCYHVFCHHVQQTGKRVTTTGSALHWLHFKNGESTYRVLKLWRGNQVNKQIC